jgi:hypothetical protein
MQCIRTAVCGGLLSTAASVLYSIFEYLTLKRRNINHPDLCKKPLLNSGLKELRKVSQKSGELVSHIEWRQNSYFIGVLGHYGMLSGQKLVFGFMKLEVVITHFPTSICHFTLAN